MTTPTLIIYDDGNGRFGPMTALRPVFSIRCGVCNTRKRIERVLGRPAEVWWVQDKLIAVTRHRHRDQQINPGLDGPDPCLLVNGRWTGAGFADQVKQLTVGEALVQSDGQTVAVGLTAKQARAFLGGDGFTLPDQVRTVRIKDRILIERPWDILDRLPSHLLADLADSEVPLIRPDDHPGVTIIGDHPVRVAEGARLMPTAVIDAEHGPVVIDRDALVNPLVVIQGPCHLGVGSTLVSHANVRQNTVIGNHCKIGGEVSASIIHDYTNKAHVGYLGDSLVGSWTNLGAGTHVSNLKNTYGNVRVQLDAGAQPEDTGRTFQGAVIGDFVRTAIGTRLPTGAVIHTGCMLAVSGWAPKIATRFGFYTDQGRQDYDIEKLIDTLSIMMMRRGVEFTEPDQSLLRQLGSVSKATNTGL